MSTGPHGSLTHRRPDTVRVPSRDDPVARAASEALGGPLGRYAAPLVRGWRYYAALVAGASSLTAAVAVVERAHCIDSGWRTPDQFWHMCFSDLPATYQDGGLSVGLVPFLTGGPSSPAVAQPPVTGFVMSLLAQLVPSGEPSTESVFYFGLWAVLAAVLLALTVWWTAASTPAHPLRAAHLALSPVVVLTILVAPDVVGVALLAAALHAWSRERLVLAGVLLGLAISARSYPVVVLLALLLVCLRSGRMQEWSRTAGATAATFLVVLAGYGALNPDAAFAAYSSWASSGAGFGAPWVIPQLAGYAVPGTAVTVLAVLGWLVAVLAAAIFALSAVRRPGVAEVTLVMVAIVLVTGKSFPVQSSLWLVPLVALVGISWRDHLIWAGAEALYFGAVWLYIAGLSVSDRGLPAGWYSFFLLVRLAGVLWLLYRVWHVAASRRPDQREPGPAADPGADPDAYPDPDPDPDRDPDPDPDPDELAGVARDREDRLIVRFR